MKHRKSIRILSALLALTLLLAIAPQRTLAAHAAQTSGKCGDNLYWGFDEATGALSIYGYGEMYDHGPVWGECTKAIRTVSLSNGMTVIGADAFNGCSKLESVVIPEGVTGLDEAAFANCTGLKSVSVPKTLQYIGHAVFQSCSALTDVSLQEGLETIEFAAFWDCSALEQISIPASVTYIGRRAFEGCSSLERISVSDGITEMGEDVLSGTAYFNNPANWTGPLLYLGNWLIASREDVAEADIRPGTVGIVERTFERRSSLTRVTFPDGLAYIGWGAFSSCERLDGFFLPDSVTHIGYGAFNGTKYYNNPYNWSGPVLYLGDWLIAYDRVTAEVRVRQGVRTIADDVFNNDICLTRVELPEGLECIGEYAFEGTGLTEIEIPFGVTSIGRDAFASCGNLVRLSLPESLTSIGSYAFSCCPSLTEATIPESVERIGEGVFNQCDSLKSVVVLSRDCTFEDGAWVFGDPSTTTVFGYPGSTAEVYAKENGYPFKDYEKCPFLDVNTSDYYAKPLAWAVKKAITNGTAPLTFSPDLTCTRAQVVTFLWRAADWPEPVNRENRFYDVKADQYYYDAVLWAVGKGVTNGVDATHFAPDSACTRGQVVTFLWRAVGSPEPTNAMNPFGDVKSDAYYYKAVLWAVENGVTKGTSAYRFSPESTCTRAQIVTFLYRAMKDDLSGEKLIMGTNAEFPPYEYYSGDRIVGIDVEIAAAIADKLDMELEIRDMAFDAIIPAILTGRIDMGMAGMTATAERRESVIFSDSYATSIQTVIVAKNSKITSVDDLSKGNLKIGVQKGTTGDFYMTWDLENEGLAAVQRYNKGADAVQALVAGKVDCVVIDDKPARAFVAANPSLTILPTPYIREDYAIAFAKGNTDLQSRVNRALMELIVDGVVREIIDRYIGG